MKPGKYEGKYADRSMVDVIPETVRMIQSLHKGGSGLSIREIVATLNDSKIPTARHVQRAFSSTAPKWHIRQVQVALRLELPPAEKIAPPVPTKKAV